MKRLLVILCFLILMYMPAISHANPKEDYEEAYKLYVAAGASVAAYTDRVGRLANRYLEQDGWKIDHYAPEKGDVGARFLLAQKDSGLGKNTYVLAIIGTETAEDVRIDLKVDKVYFAGTTVEEFAVNAARKDVPSSEPKVHKGFNEFIQAGPTALLHNEGHASVLLPDLLRNNKDAKLYLTGHSLGGAAATLAGARLISMGISPEQIEVITFGAPAVGNAAFAAKFEPTLQLTRVVMSGDPVTGVLQNLVGGYKQFGREIKWKNSTMIDEPHKMTVYVDSALKNYYDKRRQAVAAGVELPGSNNEIQAQQGKVYLAPLANNLTNDLSEDFRYMREALQNEYRQKLPGAVIVNEDGVGSWREKAAAARCRWVIVPEVSSLQIKEKKNTYYIILTQTVYEVASGAILDVAIFSTGTYNLTPLEAFVHSLRGVSIHQSAWIDN